jgi:hypothetical protein
MVFVLMMGAGESYTLLITDLMQVTLGVKIEDEI